MYIPGENAAMSVMRFQDPGLKCERDSSRGTDCIERNGSDKVNRFVDSNGNA